jgi:hypothetical protein
MDIEKAAAVINDRIKGISELYSRLLLVVGPSGSGKTAALRRVSALGGHPILNLGLELSKQLLELTDRQRIIELPKRLENLLADQRSDIVILDNTEFLFLPDLKQDPLTLLKNASRNRTIVASWLGTRDGDHVQYATPEHREFKSYSCHELELVELCSS